MRVSAGGWLAALALAAGCAPIQGAVPQPLPPTVPPPPATLRPTATSEPIPRPAENRWRVRGLNFHRDPVGTLRVFMEIAHDGPGPVEAMQVTIRLQGADGIRVGERTVSPLLDIASPGQWAPVVAAFVPGMNFSEHQVDIRAQPAETLGPRLHTSIAAREVSHAVGAYVAQEVMGVVVNEGAQAASILRVVAVCYDVAGRVVAAGSTTPEVSTLQPGGSAGFVVSLLDLAAEVASCRAEAQGMLAGIR